MLISHYWCVQLFIKLLQQNIWLEPQALWAAWKVLGGAAGSSCQHNKHHYFSHRSGHGLHEGCMHLFAGSCHWQRLLPSLPPLKRCGFSRFSFIPLPLVAVWRSFFSHSQDCWPTWSLQQRRFPWVVAAITTMEGAIQQKQQYGQCQSLMHHSQQLQQH